MESSLPDLLFFGLEMEMLVRPRSSLQPSLDKAGWNKKVVSGDPATTATEDYLALTLADEPSLDEVKPDFYLQQKYTIVQLRSILNAISFYDAAITQIMPAERKNNLWAQSNVNGEKTPSKIKMAYRAVPQRSWGPLFSIFGSIKMKAMVHREMGQDKYMSWNFGHLMDQCGTIEFRRPPGVRTAADAKHWAAFALGFINMAMTMSNGWAQYGTGTSHPSVESLGKFVRTGIARLGPSCKDALNDRKIAVDISPACVYSAAEIENINRKKSEKNKIGSVFAEKVCDFTFLTLLSH
ncbi:swim zinc finger domain protein [Seiridium cupressi]